MYRHGSAPTIRGKQMTWVPAALCALVGALGFASAAKAETVTLGHVKAIAGNQACTNCNFLEVVSDSSLSYTVPAGEWTITSWTGHGGDKDGGVRLTVYRPTGAPGQYTMLAETPFEYILAGTEPTIPTSIPVQGEDIISLTTGLGGYPPLILTGDEADKIGGIVGSVGPGTIVGTGTAQPVSTSGGKNLNIAATLTRPDPLSEVTLPTPVPAPPVPATLRLGKQLHKHNSAIVKQAITVSGPGTLIVDGKGIAHRQVNVAKAGSLAVAFSPRGSLLGALTRSGKAKATAQIVFTPTGGAATTRTETVRFRLTQ